MRRIQLIFSVCVFILFVTSCSEEKSKKEYISIKGEAQGSTFSIIYGDSLNRYFDAEITQILSAFDDELSVYLKTSLISEFNKNKIDSINLKQTQYFKPCLLRAIELNKVTDNNFNIGVKSIVDYLGFGENKKKLNNIDSVSIDSILNINGELIFANDFLKKKDKRYKFDFNAIAQGYSVDAVAELLESKGIVNYMVEIGGEMRLKGLNNKKEYWTIGLETPDSQFKNREFQEILSLTNVSIATSGNYRKFKEINGVKYSHAINPKTGSGVNHSLLSVTVITTNCIDADALATAFLVMGKEQTEKFIVNQKKIFPKLEAFFIEVDSTNKFKTYCTEGFKQYITKK
jgi:thiamine biosynthesis lipoprotein